MLRANTDDGDMVVELLVVGEITVGSLVWSNNPNVNLRRMWVP